MKLTDVFPGATSWGEYGKNVASNLTDILGGGLANYSEAYAKNTLINYEERRRLPLREKLAEQFGIIPEQAKKIKEELTKLNFDTFKQKKMEEIKNTQDFQEYYKNFISQNKGLQKVKELSKIETVKQQIIDYITNNIKDIRDSLLEKDWTGSVIPKKIEKLKKSIENASSVEEIKNILKNDAVVNQAKSLKGYPALLTDLVNILNKKNTSQQIRDEIILNKYIKDKNLLKNWKEEYQNRIKDLKEKYREILHRNLPYYQDLLAMAGKYKAPEKAIRNVLGKYAPDDIISHTDARFIIGKTLQNIYDTLGVEYKIDPANPLMFTLEGKKPPPVASFLIDIVSPFVDKNFKKSEWLALNSFFQYIPNNLNHIVKPMDIINKAKEKKMNNEELQDLLHANIYFKKFVEKMKQIIEVKKKIAGKELRSLLGNLHNNITEYSKNLAILQFKDFIKSLKSEIKSHKDNKKLLNAYNNILTTIENKKSEFINIYSDLYANLLYTIDKKGLKQFLLREMYPGKIGKLK